jgi:hypothetical protein
VIPEILGMTESPWRAIPPVVSSREASLVDVIVSMTIGSLYVWYYKEPSSSVGVDKATNELPVFASKSLIWVVYQNGRLR